jgi:hypothetical protein
MLMNIKKAFHSYGGDVDMPVAQAKVDSITLSLQDTIMTDTVFKRPMPKLFKQKGSKSSLSTVFSSGNSKRDATLISSSIELYDNLTNSPSFRKAGSLASTTKKSKISQKLEEDLLITVQDNNEFNFVDFLQEEAPNDDFLMHHGSMGDMEIFDQDLNAAHHLIPDQGVVPILGTEVSLANQSKRKASTLIDEHVNYV